MSKFNSGDDVIFTCNTDPKSSGRYTIDRLESDDVEYERASNGEVFIGEAYRLVGKDWIVPETSLRHVNEAAT